MTRLLKSERESGKQESRSRVREAREAKEEELGEQPFFTVLGSDITCSYDVVKCLNFLIFWTYFQNNVDVVGLIDRSINHIPFGHHLPPYILYRYVMDAAAADSIPKYNTWVHRCTYYLPYYVLGTYVGNTVQYLLYYLIN